MKKDKTLLDQATSEVFEILVVCTGNICRSPMAAGLLRHRLPPALRGRVTVGSAGTNALHGHQAEPHAVQTMARHGIDIRPHRARDLTRDLAQHADLILAMEHTHVESAQKMLLWHKSHAQLLTQFNPTADAAEIRDPYGHSIAAYEACFKTLEPCIDGVIAQLTTRLLASADQGLSEACRP
ncbi:MAG: low molecular weight protein-tyrosine-phosphatase [Desulfatitalea sp.]